MSEINDGGPAFPGPNDGNAPGEPGMSLRDWFAGQAIEAAACAMVESGEADHYRHVARVCYRIADAMLAERERRSAQVKP